jgi:hypothetical protein
MLNTRVHKINRYFTDKGCLGWRLRNEELEQSEGKSKDIGIWNLDVNPQQIIAGHIIYYVSFYVSNIELLLKLWNIVR